MGKKAIPVRKPYYVFNGFECGLKPKTIINMKQLPGGKLYYLVKWENIYSPTYIKGEVAKQKCALLVCEFYQKHTIFKKR